MDDESARTAVSVCGQKAVIAMSRMTRSCGVLCLCIQCVHLPNVCSACLWIVRMCVDDESETDGWNAKREGGRSGKVCVCGDGRERIGKGSSVDGMYCFRVSVYKCKNHKCHFILCCMQVYVNVQILVCRSAGPHTKLHADCKVVKILKCFAVMWMCVYRQICNV